MLDLTIPPRLLHSYGKRDWGREWLAALPSTLDARLHAWALVPDGPATSGWAALVLPVRRADGTPAVLKLQPRDGECDGEALALRTWDGDGTVRLLDDDTASNSLLLERLDGDRSLLGIPDQYEALAVLAELMARVTAHPAPAGLRRLADIAADLLAAVPGVLATYTDEAERGLVRSCAAALSEVAGEPGDRLLHWDLHYANVLAPLPGARREPWIVIDPKPLAGDPGFELLPALANNRWDDLEATGDVRSALLRRFDLMTDVLALDRERATAWTLARILQNAVWDAEYGQTRQDAHQRLTAETLLDRPR